MKPLHDHFARFPQRFAEQLFPARDVACAFDDTQPPPYVLRHCFPP